MNISLGAGGSVNLGGFGASGSVSAQVPFENPFAGLGQAAIDAVNNGAGAIRQQGGQLAEVAAAATLGVGGKLVGDGMGRVVDAFAQIQLPKLDLGGLVGRMQLPHFPPPPDIARALRPEIATSLKARFGLENSGFAGSASVKIGDVKADGTFSVKMGNLPALEMSALRDTIKTVMANAAGGAKGLLGMGIDLAAKCANSPLLSAALSMLPKGLQLLSGARDLVQGGWAHLRNFVKSLPHIHIHLPNIRIPNVRVGVAIGEPDPSGRPKAPPPPGGSTDLGTLMNSGKLTFEDFIFLFCLNVAKKQEDKIQNMINGWQAAKKAAEPGGAGTTQPGGGTTPGTGTQPGGASPAPAGDGGAGGGMAGMFSKAGSLVGGIVGFVRQVGPKVLDVASNLAGFVMPAICSAASALVGSIPGVGGILAGAVNFLGSTAGTALVKGGLSAAARFLENVPLEKLAQGGVEAAGRIAQGVASSAAGRQGTQASSSSGAAAPTSGGAGGPDPMKVGTIAGVAVGMMTFDPLMGLIAGAGIGTAAKLIGGVKNMMSGGGAAGATSPGATVPQGQPVGTNGSAPAGGGAIYTDPNTGETIDARKPDSEATFSQRMQHEMNSLQKVYEMVSNMTKGMHDMAMTSIRNMR